MTRTFNPARTALQVALGIVAAALLPAVALAQNVKVGITLSATGPAASLGIPQRNTVALLPKTIGGRGVDYIVLDDASDTTTAVKNARKFVSEDKVDVIVGSSTTPNSLAMIDVSGESETPQISMAASARIVEPVEGKRRWVFKTPQNDAQMATVVVSHMKDNKFSKVAFIGFADAYGEGWWGTFSAIAQTRGLEVVANERFQRTDTSVTGQVLKILAAKPDVVLIAASGTPAALPQKTLKERGFTGAIYQTHGVANNDFLRVCGKDCENTWLPSGPMLVASQLPADHPVRKSATAYVSAYEAANGKGSVANFGGHLWDAGVMLQAAIPVALKVAQPGTREFRAALRDALEGMKNVPAAHGVFSMSPGDHTGLDQRAAVMVQIRNGTWQLGR
jgi:branched-chain amino acid transport system substrate-binding protein